MNSPLVFLFLLQLSAGKPCMVRVVDARQRGIFDAHLYNPEQKERFCLTDIAGTSCCPAFTIGDSLVVQKTGYITWRGVFAGRQQTIVLQEKVEELPPLEIRVAKEKAVPYQWKNGSNWVIVTPRNQNRWSRMYKIALLPADTLGHFRLREIGIRCKRLQTNAPVQLHIYAANAQGLPDTAQELLQTPAVLQPEAQQKRELLFNLRKENIRISSSRFFLRLEYLWPTNKTIDSSLIGFPYYAIGPVLKVKYRSTTAEAENMGEKYVSSEDGKTYQGYLVVRLKYD